MTAISLKAEESNAFAKAALSLRYDPNDRKPAPITESQILAPRRNADTGADLWTTFNRVQENLVRGGLNARTTNGRRARTREVTGIDQSVKVNRALWLLADEMRKIKA